MSTELISTIAYAIAISIATAIMIIQNIKEKKAYNAAMQIVKLAKIVQKLPEMINEAEARVGNGQGELKKTIVMQDAQIECQNKGVNYQMEGFSNEIEKILSTPQKKFEIKGE